MKNENNTTGSVIAMKKWDNGFRHSRESSPPCGGAESIFVAHNLDSGVRRSDGQEASRHFHLFVRPGKAMVFPLPQIS